MGEPTYIMALATPTLDNGRNEATNGENRPLVTYEPVEFENNQLKFKTSAKLRIIFRGT